MNASPDLSPGLARPQDAAATAPTRRTVDAPTRAFHWLLAFSFVGAYVTADGERWRLVHETLGYTMIGLLAFRLVWGWLGPRPTRWAALTGKLAAAPAWLKGAAQGRIDWRGGQNLLLAASVLLLLGLIAPLTLSGYAVNQDWASEWLEEVHEFFGNAMLAVVLAHVALIAALSLLRGRNLAWPMVSGRSPGRGPDLVKRNRVWLGAALVAAAVAFWAWQWQQVPAGDSAAGSATAVQAQSGHAHDDDD